MKLNGASSSPPITGEARLPGTANYFVGNDSTKWRTQVPTYSKVRYGNVYDGIDLVYHSVGHDLEYDFEMQPHADPKAIEMEFDGIDRMALDSRSSYAENGPWRFQAS
jgi:hypothetical protein